VVVKVCGYRLVWIVAHPWALPNFTENAHLDHLKRCALFYFRCQRIVIVMAVGSNVAESH
jgi:hypothetical protein